MKNNTPSIILHCNILHLRAVENLSDPETTLVRQSPVLTTMPANLFDFGLEDTPANRVLILLMDKIDNLRDVSSRERQELKAWKNEVSGRMSTLEEEVRALRDTQSELMSRLSVVEAKDPRTSVTALDPRLVELESSLSSRIEAQERELKKCNVVIKGINLPRSNLVAGVSNLLSSNFAAFRGKVMEARTLKEGMTCIKLDSFKSKKDLFALKKASDLHEFYIQNDLTAAQQNAGFQLRQFARAQRALGHKVKIFQETAYVKNSQYRCDPCKKTVDLFNPYNPQRTRQHPHPPNPS